MSRIQLVVSNDTERNNSFYYDKIEDVRTFRVTGLEIAEGCGHSWRRNFLREFRKSDDLGNNASRVGTIYHLLVENHIKTWYMNEQFLTMNEILEAIKILTELGYIKEYNENFTRYVARLDKELAGAEILGLEKDLEIWPEPIVNGQVDLIYRKNGEIYIGDHKSHRPRRGRKQPNWVTKLQMNLYTYAVCNAYNVDHVNWFIGQVNLDEDARFVIEHNPELVKKRVETALYNLRNNVYQSGPQCKYCPGKETCDEYYEAQQMMLEMGLSE